MSHLRGKRTEPYRRAAESQSCNDLLSAYFLPMSPSDLWHFLPLGYFFSILIETPVLLVGLSSRHSWQRRLFAGVWLTACTYPIVTLVMPLILAGVSRAAYLVVAETFAPVGECALFWLAFGQSEDVGKA